MIEVNSLEFCVPSRPIVNRFRETAARLLVGDIRIVIEHADCDMPRMIYLINIGRVQENQQLDESVCILYYWYFFVCIYLFRLDSTLNRVYRFVKENKFQFLFVCGCGWKRNLNSDFFVGRFWIIIMMHFSPIHNTFMIRFNRRASILFYSLIPI